MKILVLCYEYPPIGGGGGRVAAQVAEKLAHRGHDIRVIAGGMSHLSPDQQRSNLRIHRINSPRRSADTCTVTEMAAFLAWAFPHALKTILQWKPDIIHAHFAVPTGALACALNRLTKTPYVITAHLGDVPGGVPQQTDTLFRLLKPFTTPIWKRAASSTAVSSFVAELAQKAYNVSPIVIKNGIVLPPPQPRVFTEPLQLLWVGRFSLQKNPLLAVEAIAHSLQSHTQLVMIGDGPLRNEMEAKIDSYGLRSRITLPGWLPAQEVSEYMWKSNALLMTSTHEGLPMVAIEAIARGLPIVSTNIPGVQDVVTHDENGFLVEQSASAIAAAINQIGASQEQLTKFSNASYNKAQQFDLDQIIDAYELVLQPSSF